MATTRAPWVPAAVVVTVWTQGGTLDADALRDLEQRAEQVTDGVDVVVETTDEDAPTEG